MALSDKENTTSKAKEKVWDISWCKRQEIRETVLLLPVAVATDSRKKKRKTVDVGGRLLTAAMITRELEEPRPAAKKRNK